MSLFALLFFLIACSAGAHKRIYGTLSAIQDSSCLSLVQSHCLCEKGCKWHSEGSLCWPDKGCAYEATMQRSSNERSTSPFVSNPPQWAMGVAMNPEECYMTGGGLNMNQQRTCLLLQYGQWQDVNGDGLIDIIWQVSVGPTFSYLTLINNSTTKRFDATSCASSDPTWCTHFEPTPEYLIKTVRAMSRERIIIRLFNDSESAVEIARPYSLDDLLDSAAKYLAINGPCRIFRVGSGARITSVAHVLSGESIEFRCF